MAYCTAAQVREILIRVTTASLSDVAVGLFIARADSFIDGKIASIYALPFTITPPLITTISTYLSAYGVAMALFTRDGQNTNDWVLQLRTDAYELLKDLIEGKLQLVSSSGALISKAVDNYYSNNKDYQPVFDMDKDIDWKIDSNLLENIADERN